MLARYQNICDAFPVDRIDKRVLPLFLDWLRELVVLVEIIAYSDENAYTIFETMNDRGLNLTPTEMLKGFLLSKYRDDNKRKQSNDFWKQTIIDLKVFDKEEDQRFIQAWLRAKYAESIRQSKAGSLNEDFEKIGTRLAAAKEGSGATPKDPKTELFNEIIERMNDLFIEDGLSENDMLNYANTIAGKISENELLVA